MNTEELQAFLDAPPRPTVGNHVVIGVVTNVGSSEHAGCVRVRFPWLNDDDESEWARVVAPMAGNGRGVWCLPAVEDEVLVAFERGDLRKPYVLGSLWNGVDKPPAATGDVLVVKSRSGHVVRLTDTENGEKIEITDHAGSSVTFDSQGITVSTNGKLKVDAAQIELTAKGTLTIKGAMVEIN